MGIKLIRHSLLLLLLVLKDKEFTHGKRIEDEISGMCPYTDFCSREAVEKLDKPNRQPCCESCSCADDCREQHNCCYDKKDAIPSTKELACKPAMVKTRNIASDNSWTKGFKSIGYYIVDRCPVDETNATLQYKCAGGMGKEIDDFVWVTDSKSERIFQNRYCAQCYGVKMWTSWLVRTLCVDILEADFQSITEIVLSPLCNIINQPPKSQLDISRQFECLLPDITACNQTGLWSKYDATIEDACTTNKVPFFQGLFNPIVYKNMFCFLCNHDGGVSADTVCLKRQKGKKFSSFSINVLIDFGKIKETIASPAPSECDIDYIKDIYMVRYSLFL